MIMDGRDGNVTNLWYPDMELILPYQTMFFFKVYYIILMRPGYTDDIYDTGRNIEEESYL